MMSFESLNQNVPEATSIPKASVDFHFAWSYVDQILSLASDVINAI